MKNQTVKTLLKELFSGLSAGVLISIGCAVFLALSDKKIAGAVLFSVALLCICYKSYNLYTGRIGFIVQKHDKQAFINLFTGLLGNLLGTLICGIALGYAITSLYNSAEVLCTAKLTQEIWQTLIRAVFCGILMYLAVSVFKDSKTPLGILFCIPVFILSGFEHSIADMGYFFTARLFSIDAVLFIVIVIVGNSLGAMILPFMNGIIKDKKEDGETK